MIYDDFRMWFISFRSIFTHFVLETGANHLFLCKYARMREIKWESDKCWKILENHQNSKKIWFFFKWLTSVPIWFSESSGSFYVHFLWFFSEFHIFQLLFHSVHVEKRDSCTFPLLLHQIHYELRLFSLHALKIVISLIFEKKQNMKHVKKYQFHWNITNNDKKWNPKWQKTISECVLDTLKGFEIFHFWQYFQWCRAQGPLDLIYHQKYT